MFVVVSPVSSHFCTLLATILMISPPNGPGESRTFHGVLVVARDFTGETFDVVAELDKDRRLSRVEIRRLDDKEESVTATRAGDDWTFLSRPGRGKVAAIKDDPHVDGQFTKKQAVLMEIFARSRWSLHRGPGFVAVSHPSNEQYTMTMTYWAVAAKVLDKETKHKARLVPAPVPAK